MMNPHNVDICVTCVSDKPPQLPLREELASLGIEVVYNAQGVGAKASRSEQKRKLREYQEEKLKQNGFFHRLLKNKDAERQRDEEMRQPHALSYSSYEQRLRQQKEPDGTKEETKRQPIEAPAASPESPSISHGGTTTSISELESSQEESSHRGSPHDKYATPLSPTQSKEQLKPPIRSLEIPTHSPEELAVRQAFDVFANGVATQCPEQRSQNNLTSRGGSTSRDTRSEYQGISHSRSDASSEDLFNRHTSGSRNGTRVAKIQVDTEPVYTPAPAPSSRVARGRGPPVPRREPPEDRNMSSEETSENEETPSLEYLQEMAAAFLSKPSPTAGQLSINQLDRLHLHKRRHQQLQEEEEAVLEEKSRIPKSAANTQNRLANPVPTRISKRQETAENVPPIRQTAPDRSHFLPPSSSSRPVVMDQRMEQMQRRDDIEDVYDRNPIPSEELYPDDFTPSSPKSIKVSRVSRNNNLAEHYDLTELSEGDAPSEQDDNEVELVSSSYTLSNELSTLSSKLGMDSSLSGRGNVQVYQSSRLQEPLPGLLRFRLPEYEEEGKGDDDDFGRLVLDLSNVNEENGPGSPLIYSPTRSPIRQAEGRRDVDAGDYSSPINAEEYSPREIYSPMRDGYDLRHDDPFDDYDYGVEKRLFLLRSSRGKALFDETTTVTRSNRSRFTFDTPIPSTDPQFEEEKHQSYSPQSRKQLRFDRNVKSDYENQLRKSHSVESYHGNEIIDAEQNVARQHYLPPASPKHWDFGKNDADDNEEEEEKHGEEKRSAPSTSRNSAFEAEDNQRLCVTFSEDKDIRYYNDEEEEEGKASFHGIGKLANEIEGRLSLPSQDKVQQRFEKDFPAAWQHLKEKTTEEALVEYLVGDTMFLPQDTNQFIAKNKSFVNTMIPGTKMYPLHALCSLLFPDRYEGAGPSLLKELVTDIVERKKLILAFLQADSKCSTYVDSNNDLPVHLISRLLMEWEAKWYQKVYERAREDGSQPGGQGATITTLYQTMSEVADILLLPLAKKKELCQQPGSSGYILPLHIAAIFTVSYNTLRSIIERYPDAAKQKCNLGNMRTFIPNFSVPLDLHSRLSTDFPKWEIQQSDCDMEIQWTQSTLDQSYGTVDGMRRSDLMFAYHPDVKPYRQESQRIRRMETRIRAEIERVEAGERKELSEPVRLLWEWVCTFKGDNDEDNYALSVRRIVQSLSTKAIKLLCIVPSKSGNPVMDNAITACSLAIEEKLKEITMDCVPLPVDSLASSSKRHGPACHFWSNWEGNMAKYFGLQGRGFAGVLCRALFNIADTSFPTNFVLLPYKLVKDRHGRLGLESAEAAAVAMRFADALLQLTDPLKVLHFLEKKALRFQGTSLGIQASPDWDLVEAKTKKEVSKLLSLYASGKAHLYFIDEYTGVPVVPDRDDVYPIMISDAMHTVRKILPLMMSGMILMRGEKALSVLAQVLLNDNIQLVQEHWMLAAKDLVGYLYSAKKDSSKAHLQDLKALREPLVEFLERGVSGNAPTPHSDALAGEWVVEISHLKMLVEMYDPQHKLSGLQSREAGSQVLWTRETSILDETTFKNKLLRIEFKALDFLKAQSETDPLQSSSSSSSSSSSQEEYSDDSLEDDQVASAAKGRGNDLEAKSDSSFSSESNMSQVGGYDLLFRELSYPKYSATMKKSSIRKDDDVMEDNDDAEQMRTMYTFEPFPPEPPAIVRKTRRKCLIETAVHASLFQFDEDLGVDDAMELRILLDEQEAKLDYLRDKVRALEDAHMNLLDQEDRIGDLIEEVNAQSVATLQETPSGVVGLSGARKLLLRLCDLEERIQLREVELGQLRNETTCFQLEASDHRMYE